jgi:hypothetical protein
MFFIVIGRMDLPITITRLLFLGRLAIDFSLITRTSHIVSLK